MGGRLGLLSSENNTTVNEASAYYSQYQEQPIRLQTSGRMGAAATSGLFDPSPSQRSAQSSQQSASDRPSRRQHAAHSQGHSSHAPDARISLASGGAASNESSDVIGGLTRSQLEQLILQRHYQQLQHQAGSSQPGASSSSSRGNRSASTGSAFSAARFFRPRSYGGAEMYGASGNRSSSDSDEETDRELRFHQLSQLFPYFRSDIKCRLCNKMIPYDDHEVHFVMCLTKPRVTYNEDILTEDKGECAICLEDMNQGDKIARLPCLCVYHKECIADWFKRSQTCPEHPGD